MQLEGDSGGGGGGGTDWSAKVNVRPPASAALSSAWETARSLCCGLCEIERQFREEEELRAQVARDGGSNGRGGRFGRGMEILVVGLMNKDVAIHNGKRGNSSTTLIAALSLENANTMCKSPSRRDFSLKCSDIRTNRAHYRL